MTIKQTKIETGTAFLEANITSDEIEVEKNRVVDEMIKSVSVKGFRTGKAPKSIAEKELDPNRLSDHLLNHIMNHLLEQAIKENKYRLLGRPVLEEIKTKKEGGWSVKLQLPFYPLIKLGNYQKYLKSKTKDKKIEDVYTKLLENERFAVSPLVINEEVNYSLERLNAQAKSLNLPIDDYLKALNKNLEQVKKEYAASAENSVRLDLILLEIAKKEGIDTQDTELLELAKVSNLPNTQPDQLRSVVNRRKTLDLLMTL